MKFLLFASILFAKYYDRKSASHRRWIIIDIQEKCVVNVYINHNVYRSSHLFVLYLFFSLPSGSGCQYILMYVNLLKIS